MWFITCMLRLNLVFSLLVNCLIPCQVGDRQGDWLSPLLFALNLSNLNTFISKHCEGLKLVPAFASEFIYDKKLLYYLNCRY